MSIWDILSGYDGSEKEHSEELRKLMRKSHKRMVRQETGGNQEAAIKGGNAIKELDPTLSQVRKHIDFESEHMQEVMSNNGKTQGDINAENGHMQRIQKIGCSLGGQKAAQMPHMEATRKKSGQISCAKQYTCPHCGFEGEGPTMFNGHFDKCMGYIDIFEWNGEQGQLLGTYNNREDILRDFDSISKGVLQSALKGKKKRHHPHYVGGYLAIPRGIKNNNK